MNRYLPNTEVQYHVWTGISPTLKSSLHDWKIILISHNPSSYLLHSNEKKFFILDGQEIRL